MNELSINDNDMRLAKRKSRGEEKEEEKKDKTFWCGICQIKCKNELFGAETLKEELEIAKETNINELKELEVNFSPPNCLEIKVSNLLTVEAIGKLLYSIYNKLNYLFDHLEYRIVDKRDLIFFYEQKELLENFILRRNVIYLRLLEQSDLDNWKAKFAVLKEILEKLGLTGLRFGKEKSANNNNPQTTLAKNKDSEIIEGRKKSNLGSSNNQPINGGKRLNKSILFREWKGRKLFELGVHSKFSTLDGISSPVDYATSARKKNYAALAITDHYNVQSFPEFSKHQSSDLKIIYGCEMEMLEDKLPPYLFNYSEQFLEKKINDLTYCVFDLETTGFFSQYNEIIEIGYVIYHQGEIIQEKEYLICPEKEISAEWEGCVLVAHNAGKFDYGFLNKVWKENFEKLSHVPGRGKIVQTHRALDDSKLLAELLGKLLKTLKENKISHSQEGLYNLYRLITLSHTKNLFKKPSVFCSDLAKYRSGLLIGAAGGREGETFSLFSSFNFEEKKQAKLRFYDYLE
ncbi:1504_t:CDS:2, partial [Funneliformis geosporum]